MAEAAARPRSLVDAAEGDDRAACPARRLDRRSDRSRPAAGADPMAGRAGAADHLAAGHHPAAGRRPGEDDNVGVYRMQVLGRDRAIIRWLAHRGGARHHRQWQDRGLDMPVAVAIGADPATMLAAVLPLPETLSELRFSGLLRGERPRLARCVTVPLMVPAEAEIVIEGMVSRDRNRARRPLRRSHRLLQRGRGFSGDDASPRSPCARNRSMSRPSPAGRPTSHRESAKP